MSKMSDLRRQSVRLARLARRDKVVGLSVRRWRRDLQATGGGHDLTIGDIHAKLTAAGLRKTHRQVQRWAERGFIPGAYRQKQGRGHWRVRVCDALAAWMFQMSMRAPVWKQLGGAFKAIKPLTDGHLAELQVKHRMAFKELLQSDDEKVAAEMALPYATMPTRYKRQLAANADKLQFALAASAVSARGVRARDMVEAICAELGISRATFERRGYVKLLEQYHAGQGVVEKDSRARKQYANQVLQETEVDGD